MNAVQLTGMLLAMSMFVTAKMNADREQEPTRVRARTDALNDAVLGQFVS